jgi:hypothetical protein
MAKSRSALQALRRPRHGGGKKKPEMKTTLSILAVLILMGINARAGTFTLTGPGSNGTVTENNGTGVYVGPYVATVDGVANVQVVCDDFADETFINESWTTNTTNFSSTGLSSSTNEYYSGGTNGGSLTQLQAYQQVAWLSEQLMNPSNTTATDAAIQLAIWQIFDSSTLSNFTTNESGDVTAANSWLALAAAQTYTPGEFSNVQILSYAAGSAITGQSNGRPQEFILVTPEPASALLLLIVFCALGGAMAYSRKPQTV